MKKTNKSGKKIHFSLFNNINSNTPGGNITYILSFIIPVFIMILLYYIRDIFPFGDKCYLRSDMYHQYAPFFSEFWHKIRSGEALTYSFDIGMGTNFISLYAYYLASPANWFIALFPQKSMIEIMNTLIIIKLSLASTSFTYYISKHFNTKNCTIVFFSIFYALSAYSAAYSWNIMWLDCMILIPLIMLGLERLVNENKCFLYCISLGLCILTNYYIGIMVCLSVIIYFIVLMVSYNGNKHPRIYLKKFINWCIYSLLAGGLAACLLLPEIYTFSLSASSDTTFPKTITVYFSVLEMLTRQLINTPVHLGLEHFPNIYCGVFIFLLIPLYILDKKISIRQKAGKLIILLIFLLSYNINVFNFIWHGFHYPNSLPCRQAFIYIFFILTMCYEAFAHLKENKDINLYISIWCAVGFLIIAEQLFTGKDNFDVKTIYISGLFILIYALFLILYKKIEFKFPYLLFAGIAVCIIECMINMEVTGLGTTGRSAYLLDYDAVEYVTDQVSQNDSDFYRMDKVFGERAKNDGAWHNYHSIATFSSTSNAGMSEFLGYLGFEHSTNAYGYQGATMITNSLFSVKYVISNQHLTESPLVKYYTGHDGEFIYQNTYTLPIGYMVNNEAVNEWQPNSMYNGIENQNHFIEKATGIANVFTQTYEYKTESDVTFSPIKNGHLYLNIGNSAVESVGVKINGSVNNYTGLKNGSHIIDIGYVTTSDSIQIYSDTSMNLTVYTLEENRFIQVYNTLKNNSVNVTDHTTTSFTGTINAVDNKTLIFSIPYDKGWSIYVDGKKTETFAAQNALLAVNLESGNHSIKLKYRPVNLILGCILTLICIIILIAVYIFRKFEKNKKVNLTILPSFIQEFLSKDDIIIHGTIIEEIEKDFKTSPDLELITKLEEEIHDVEIDKQITAKNNKNININDVKNNNK